MLEYLKVIGKQTHDNRYPHPLVKSIMMATSKAQELSKEGKNIGAISDDSDVTYEGKPMMVFYVTAKMNSGICEFTNVIEISERFECTSDIIEKIIRTEIFLERQEGKDVKSSLFIEAVNAIGIKIKMIKKCEIPDAIRSAKEFINTKKLEGVDKDIIDQLSAIRGAEEWDDLDMTVRNLIDQIYGFKKYPDYNAFMTPTDIIRKSKARGMIVATLKQEHLETA